MFPAQNRFFRFSVGKNLWGAPENEHSKASLGLQEKPYLEMYTITVKSGLEAWSYTKYRVQLVIRQLDGC